MTSSTWVRKLSLMEGNMDNEGYSVEARHGIPNTWEIWLVRRGSGYGRYCGLLLDCHNETEVRDGMRARAAQGRIRGSLPVAISNPQGADWVEAAS